MKNKGETAEILHEDYAQQRDWAVLYLVKEYLY